MKTLRALALRLAGVFSKGRREQEFATEIDSHLQMQIEDNLRRGMSAEEARREAILKLGGMEQTRQAYRERGTMPFVENLLHDIRYTLRQCRREPAFAVTVAIVLATGIGASAAIFSVVNPILFRPLPYPAAERVMMMWESRRAEKPMYVAFATFYGLRGRARSFQSLAVMRPWQPAMVGSGEPERLEGQLVSADYFKVLGVLPALGRNFVTADDGFHGPANVILSNALWRRRFAANPQIIGSKITLDNNPYTVLGVMPASFDNVLAPAAELWAPLQFNPALPIDGREWGHNLQMIGRLRQGVSRQEAQSESTVILHALGQEYAKGYDNSGGASQGMLVYRLQDDLTRDVKPVLLAIVGGVMLLLLIACVNVANLLLARGARRRSEFAMRTALGAGRARLVQQLLTESLLFSIGGGVLGIALAIGGVRALVALSPPDLPRLGAIRLDGAVFFFAFAITTLVGLLVGLVPALHAAHGNLQSGLQQSSRTMTGKQQLMRRALVISEMSIALVLLVSAGLLLRSVQRLFAIPPGFQSSHLLSMQVQDYSRRPISEAEWPAFDAARARFYERALQAVREIPGVQDAAFTSQLPLSGDFDGNSLQFESSSSEKAIGAYRYGVTPAYFATMRIPLLRGRLLTENDKAGAPGAVLISASLAQRLFRDRDPVGERVRMGPDMGHPDRPWHVVVGVVGNVKQSSLALDDSDAFYTTPTQWAWVDNVQSLVVRTEGDPTLLIAAVRSAIWSVDKDQPIVRVATMDKLVAESEAQRHFALVLFEAFALVGLLLAAIGIYGVLSGSVTERIRELGVRAALGATRGDILALVLRQGMQLAGIGIVIGLAGALALSRGLTTLLFGISERDPITYAAVTAALLAVAAVACWIPARRAAQVDPAVTLRTQ
jgi:putative ABC transport system permease protein